MDDIRICSVCGKAHAASNIELIFRRPDIIAALSIDERASRVRESEDLAILDETRYFIRCLLPLAVAGRDDPYCFGIWAEVPQSTFERIRSLWRDADQASEPAFDCRLANEIPSLPPTVGVVAKLSLSGPTTRPDIHIVECDHPLFDEQSRGITEHRVSEYGSYIPDA